MLEIDVNRIAKEEQFVARIVHAGTARRKAPENSAGSELCPIRRNDGTIVRIETYILRRPSLIVLGNPEGTKALEDLGKN